MKHTLVTTAVAATLSAFAGGAMAAADISALIPATGTVQLSDNSAEQHIDTNNNGILDQGERLAGIFSIDNFTSSIPQTAIGAGTIYNELTGVFDITVLTKTAPNAQGRSDFTFGPTNGNIVGSIYQDAAQDFTRTACAFASCVASATNGNLWGNFTSVFWSSVNSPDTPATGGNLPLTTPLGSFSFGLNFNTNNTGFTWGKVQCVDLTDNSVHLVDLCGQGGIIATGRNVGGANTPYDLFDNVDLTLTRAAVVPEPASIALVGLALLGLGAASRKRKV